MPGEENKSEQPRTEPIAPILDYGKAEKSEFNQFLKVLLIEFAMLLFGSIVLDGGMMLRLIAIFFVGYWLLAGIMKWWQGHHPTWKDRLYFGIGVSIAALAPFMM